MAASSSVMASRSDGRFKMRRTTTEANANQVMSAGGHQRIHNRRKLLRPLRPGSEDNWTGPRNCPMLALQ